MPRRNPGDAGNPTPAGLITKHFYGAVLLQNYISTPYGGQVLGIVGDCSVLEDKEALGFEVNARDSKWLVRVAGRTMSVSVPGCQIRLVMAFPKDGAATNHADYWVIP